MACVVMARVAQAHALARGVLQAQDAVMMRVLDIHVGTSKLELVLLNVFNALFNLGYYDYYYYYYYYYYYSYFYYYAPQRL